MNTENILSIDADNSCGRLISRLMHTFMAIRVRIIALILLVIFLLLIVPVYLSGKNIPPLAAFGIDAGISQLCIGQPGVNDNAYVTAEGTFIQWWLVQDWDEAAWFREFTALKEAGMKYIILGPTAFYKGNLLNGAGTTSVVFPIQPPLQQAPGLQIPEQPSGFMTIRRADGTDYPDVVDICLRTAKQFGFRVFIGLNYSDDWWNSQYSREWVAARVDEGNKLADELWRRYYEKYVGTFYGWYWCWEVNNSFLRQFNLLNSWEVLAETLRMQTEYLENTGKRLPIMLSPFMDRRFGSPRLNAEMWKYVFARSGLREGDVFCPQDSVGSGGLDIDDLPVWFAELRKSVDTLPGLRFWSDTETFVSSDWTGAPINRFVQQMRAVSPYVDKQITFAYSHYYSPNIVNDGFHKTYTGYIKSGILDKVAPTAPEGISAFPGKEGKIYLKWEPSSDNIGVCGYYVYRNGRMVANLQVPRKSMSEYQQEAPVNLEDTIPDTQKTYSYEIKAYDFAGNVSRTAAKIISAAH